MPDYGHPIELGLRITSPLSAPHEAVSLAADAEAFGLDVVAVVGVQELDPWTVSGWIAGATERIRIIAEAAIDQGQPATVLARAGASLDLLSHGRLGILLRGDDDAAPLAEAIDVLHAMWGGEVPSLRYDGEHQRANGAATGPAPAHNVPIYLAEQGESSLDLAGRSADGVLLDLSTSSPDHHSTIDHFATAVGRDPREIRRVAIVSPPEDCPAALDPETPFTQPDGTTIIGLDGDARWVSRLAHLAQAHGIGTFLLDSHDPTEVERFATVIAPALKLAMRAVRTADGITENVLRPRHIRDKRHEGIDYDAVPAAIAHTAIEPGDAGYPRVKSTYLRGGAPGLVLQPRDVEHVREALAFARTQDVRLGIRSAGHGISGRSTNDGGIVIDVSRLNAIEVLDAAARRVRIEPGARWGEVAKALAPYGWALSSGDSGGVGAGGISTSGGIGFLGREHGLTIDHLVAATVVLADGAVVRASAEDNPELFWALRGAGANFGIVVSFEFEVQEVGELGYAQLAFDASETADFLEEWGAYVESAPRDVTSFLMLGGPRRGQPMIAQITTVVNSDDADTIIERLQPLANIAPLVGQSVSIVSYPDIVAVPDELHYSASEPVTRSALVEHLTPELTAALAELIHSGETFFFQIRAVGGAISDVPKDATAYAHRSANFSLVAFGANRRRLDVNWDAMEEHFLGLYTNFETDERPARLHDAYPPATLARLKELKRALDPDNVFRDNFNVEP